MLSQARLSDDPRVHGLDLHKLILKQWRQRFSGTLCLEQGKKKKAFLFDQGSPVQVTSNLESNSLTLFLTQTGKISTQDAERTREQVRKSAGHEGLAILKLGLMDAPTLFASIRSQLEQSLAESLQWNSGHYRVDREQAPGSDLAPFRLDPIPILQQSLGQSRNLESLLAELQTDLPRYPVTQTHTKKVWARLKHTEGLDPTRWNPELSLNQNLAGTALTTNHSIALWILIASGALVMNEPPGFTKSAEPRTENPVCQGSSRAAPSPTKPLSRPRSNTEAQALAFKESLTQLRKQAETSSHYALLGLENRCTESEIRRAYLRAAKVYHPDATLKYGDKALKEEASLVFSHITEAFEVLSHADRRQEYDALLRGEATEAPAHHIAQAEIGYQKAEILLRMGQFKEAIPYLKQAVTLVPDEEEFHASLGWALYKAPNSEPRLAREALENAIKLKSDHALAHFRLGIVCRSLGDTKASENALARAKELEKAQSSAN